MLGLDCRRAASKSGSGGRAIPHKARRTGIREKQRSLSGGDLALGKGGRRTHRGDKQLMEALTFCDYAYLLESGTIVAQGRGAELPSNPVICQAYAE